MIKETIKLLLMFGSALYTFGFMLFTVYACIYGQWCIVPDALLPYEAFLLIPLLFAFQVFLVALFAIDLIRSLKEKPKNVVNDNGNP